MRDLLFDVSYCY